MYYPREARRDFLYTKLAALLLLGFVGGGAAVWSFQQGMEYGLITLSPRQSQGRVVAIEERRDTVVVTFEFQDNDLIRHSDDLLQRKQLALPLRPGDDVSVLYFSAYPSVAQLEMQLSKQAISFYILLACFCFHLGAGFFILQAIRQIRRLAAEDRYY